MYLNLEIFAISLDTSVTCWTDQDDFNLTFNLIRDDTKKLELIIFNALWVLILINDSARIVIIGE